MATKNTPKLPRRKATLTRPLFSVAHTPHLYIKVSGPVFTKSMPSFARSEDGMVPLCPVVDMETGEEGDLIVPAILFGIFERDPDYVGKCYEIEAGEKREGKAYRDLKVYEVEE